MHGIMAFFPVFLGSCQLFREWIQRLPYNPCGVRRLKSVSGCSCELSPVRQVQTDAGDSATRVIEF